jgi:hypothetical protein
LVIVLAAVLVALACGCGSGVWRVNQTVRNERKKLLATWYNNFSIAVLVAGFLTPFWTIIYGTSQPQSGDLTRIAGFAICVVLGALLRYLAHRTLGELEE